MDVGAPNTRWVEYFGVVVRATPVARSGKSGVLLGNEKEYLHASVLFPK
jgi:hypothetical protein